VITLLADTDELICKLPDITASPVKGNAAPPPPF